MTSQPCTLCGKAAAASVQGSAGTLRVCRPCSVDVVPVLLAKSLHEPASVARGVPGAAAAWALVSDKFFRHVAYLASPPKPPSCELVPGAHPQLRYETGIVWVSGFDVSAAPYVRERVSLCHGRDKRGLKFFRLVGWACLSPDAPDESRRGMKGFYRRRNFWLARGDPLPAGAKLKEECIDPRSIRPGVFGTPIGTVKGGNHAQ